MSARAQSALTWILEDILDNCLKDARNLAEAANKQRIELDEVEQALKQLCERYHARWSTENPTVVERKKELEVNDKSNKSKSKDNTSINSRVKKD